MSHTAEWAPFYTADDQEEEEFYLKSRIINVLKNYPILSPSMLQLGIGPHIKSRIWKPVLEDLIKEGSLEREFISVPSERGGFRTICRLKLSDHCHY
jgi:hypothetical protein